MIRIRIDAKVVRCVVLLGIIVGLAPAVRGEPITFVSDTSWNVTDPSNNPIGKAQFVALNGTDPVTRPAGATVYGYPFGGWRTDLSSIPGAFWIWAPGITGATPNASLAEYFFSRSFDLTGTPVSGKISISADDFAEVLVNGKSAGTTGSVTNASLSIAGQSALTLFDITTLLVSGPNTITIRAQNGPEEFSGFPNPNYSLNPAGVVFGGELVSQAVPAPSGFVLSMMGLGGSCLWYSRSLWYRRTRYCARA